MAAAAVGDSLHDEFRRPEHAHPAEQINARDELHGEVPLPGLLE